MMYKKILIVLLFVLITSPVFSAGSSGGSSGGDAKPVTQYEIALKQFQKASKELEKIVNVEIPKLNKQLDAANAPWTPGRKIPRVK